MADLHEALRKRLRVQDVWFAGRDGRHWVGAVAPVDPSEAGLGRVVAQLRADYRVRPLSISVGVFP